MPAPSIADSTREERLAYVKQRYACISNCDACGLCVIFHRQDPTDALSDYIEGICELREAMLQYR